MRLPPKSKLIACSAVLSLLAIASGTSVGLSQTKPNIILIVLDDADSDLLAPEMLDKYFPNINALAVQGTRFTNYHVTTSLCCPSRASLLLGQYAHTTGVKVNLDNTRCSNGFSGGVRAYFRNGHHLNDLPVRLREAGYHTAIVGKYLHGGMRRFVPPGWVEFYESLGARYYDTYQFTTRTEPGGCFSRTGERFRTDVELADALGIIERLSANTVERIPFFLYVAPLAPHAAELNSDVRPVAASDADNPFAQVAARIQTSPDFDEADFSDKPSHYQSLGPIDEVQRKAIEAACLHRLRSLSNVDDMIGKIVGELRARGLIDQTIIFLTSDNGFQLGHHRLVGKVTPYDRCSRVPLIVWGLGVEPNSTREQLVANIDVAPTILELAGLPIPKSVEGKSFAPLLRGNGGDSPREWRTAILLENWEQAVCRGAELPTSFVSVRSFDKVFTTWANGEREYYDLHVDPFQLDNRVGELSEQDFADYEQLIRSLRKAPSRPLVSLILPAVDDSNRQPSVTFRGVVEAEKGVAEVRLAIRDKRLGRFWDGSTWVGRYADIRIVPKAQGVIAEWQYEYQGHIGEVSHRRVQISAFAIDHDGFVSPGAVSLWPLRGNNRQSQFVDRDEETQSASEPADGQESDEGD